MVSPEFLVRSSELSNSPVSTTVKVWGTGSTVARSCRNGTGNSKQGLSWFLVFLFFIFIFFMCIYFLFFFFTICVTKTKRILVVPSPAPLYCQKLAPSLGLWFFDYVLGAFSRLWVYGSPKFKRGTLGFTCYSKIASIVRYGVHVLMSGRTVPVSP